MEMQVMLRKHNYCRWKNLKYYDMSFVKEMLGAKMITVDIVEDEEAYAKQLMEYIIC